MTEKKTYGILLAVILCLGLCVSLWAEDQDDLAAFFKAKNLPIYKPSIEFKNFTAAKETHRAIQPESKKSLTSSLSTQFKKGKDLIPSELSALAPEHMAIVSVSQPVLRWYISGPWAGGILFTLNEKGVQAPILEAYVEGVSGEGIYRISLTDYKITLKQDVDYEWFLTIASEKADSPDMVSGAAIRYVEPSPAVLDRLAQTPQKKQHYVYAESGYWYDAIERISSLIDIYPNDMDLKTQRGGLLAQVGLNQAAVYDSAEYKFLVK
jgi:hypothetical protein